MYQVVRATGKRNFVAWVSGCPHVPADTSNGRSAVSSAISDVESSKVSRVDVAFCLGDFSTNQNPTEIATYATEGVDCATQLGSGTNKINRNKIYTLRGNHDPGDGQNDWYDRYIDRNGVNTAFSGVTDALRPFPIQNKTADYYSITTGNVIWLVLDDINHGAQPCGRSGGSGGFPAGSTSLAAYNWWVSMIENNPGKIIITCAHHLLKNTTIATGDNEGVNGGYHGSSGQAIGSGRLHNVITDFNANTYEADQTRFMDYLAVHPGACSIWLGAHTHYNVGETYSGRGYTTTVNGCAFVNVGTLSRHHGTPKNPQSKFLTFTVGSNQVMMNNFVHDTSYQNIGYNGDTVAITVPVAFSY
jgi:hypothetical protein